MPEILRPATQIAGYELVRPLDAGGMGDVWLATELRAQRAVALKFVKPHLLSDPTFHTRFLNEAKTLGRLEHDRIVPLYNVLDAEGHLALVLRFIEGESLAKRIDRDGALPLDVVIAYARDILPALEYAHGRGTIHRDIKPQNILIDQQSRAFLTDFGIAVTDVVERHTVVGFSVGSPHYMSPEQIRTPQDITAGPTGRLSDIYSVGVVLYEMLTGSVPFGADFAASDTYRVQHAHCVEAPPPLREKNARVPEPVERLVLACLAKSPSERPQSCAEVLHRLEAAAAQAPGTAAGSAIPRVATEFVPPRKPEPAGRVAVPPPADRPKSRSWARARPLAAALILVGALVGFTIWSSGGETPGTAPRQDAKPPVNPSPPPPIVEPVGQSGRGSVPGGRANVPDPGGRDSRQQERPQPTVTGRGPEQGRSAGPNVATPAAPTAPSEEDAYVRQLVEEARKLSTENPASWCAAAVKMDQAAKAAAEARRPLTPKDRDFRDLASQMCKSG